MQEANTAYVDNLTLLELKVVFSLNKYLHSYFNFAFMADMFLLKVAKKVVQSKFFFTSNFFEYSFLNSLARRCPKLMIFFIMYLFLVHSPFM